MDILPVEITRKIFRYLKQEDLQRCYFVCKSWHSITFPLNWEEVSLNGDQVDLVKSYLKDFDHGRYFKYGHLITKLKIKEFYGSFRENRHEFSESELLVLLDQFPNLEEIDFNSSCYLNEYLEILLDTKNHHFKKINAQRILFSDKIYLQNLFFLVHYKFRKSITCMNIYYNRSTIYCQSQQINVLDSLAQFEQLTELAFYNKHDADLTPLQLQKMCPNLKFLSFASDYPISESITLRLLENSSRIDLNLMNLNLNVPSLSPTYTKYLADHLPNQLTVLNISNRAQNMFDWVDLVGIVIASRFMEKACKVKDVLIGFKGDNRYEALTGDETRATTFFRLLNAFRRTPQTYCEAKFYGNSCNGKGIGHWLSYRRDNILHFLYDVNVDPLFFMDLPDNTRSVIGPEVFSSLAFNMDRMNNDAVDPILTYSFLNCPNIQSFYLSCESNQSESCEGFYLRYSHKEDVISSNAAHQRDINYLEMAYFKTIQPYFNSSSSYLHDIEVIDLRTENSRYIDYGSVIDLTVFKKLKTFTYYIGIDYKEYDNNDYDNFICIDYTNGDKKCYDLDKEEYKPDDELKNPCITIFCDRSVDLEICRD